MTAEATPKLLTPREVARILNLSVTTLLRHVRRGTIRAVHVGKQVRFREEDIQQLLES